MDKAARHLDLETWLARALDESEPDAAIGSLLAATRTIEDGQQSEITDALVQIAGRELNGRQRVDLLRTLGVTFARHGRPNDEHRNHLVATLKPHFPSESRALNHELCRMLVYLGSEDVVEQAVSLMARSVTQEDLLAYGMMLRVADQGWTDVSRRSYFSLLNKLETGAATAD